MKFHKYILIILFFISQSNYHAYSQSKKNPSNHIFEFKWANDFVFETDRYFSNGLELTYYAPFLRKSPINYILLPAKKQEIVYYGITITQHFFTPDELFSAFVNEQDRPFASYLLIGQVKVSINRQKGLKMHSGLQVGLLGKYSGGESIQNNIHEILPTSQPALGWLNQIQPDLALNYLIRIEKGLLRNKNFEIIPLASLKAGIPYTETGGAVKIRLGKLNDYFSGNSFKREKPWQIYVFIEMGGKYVFYNATLQGGLFNNNPYVMSDISHWVAQLNTAIAFSVRGFGIEFGQHFITPEFNSGMPHKWGYLSLKFVF